MIEVSLSSWTDIKNGFMTLVYIKIMKERLICGKKCEMEVNEKFTKEEEEEEELKNRQNSNNDSNNNINDNTTTKTKITTTIIIIIIRN